MSDSEDPIDPIDDGGDDLFGDDDDQELGSQAPASPRERVLDDDDLASDPEGYDTARRRDYDDDEEREPEHDVKQHVIIDMTAYRHPVPKPTDGTLRALRVPKFLRFHPEAYTDDFEPSEADIENARAERPLQVARFKRDDSTGHLHSNTNILRWSDGSMTISVGGEQFEIRQKPLAPPPNKPYNEVQDTHYYAAAAELSSNMLMTVGHVTEQYDVRPNATGGDEALKYFKQSMAKEKKAGTTERLFKTTVDPELQKKKAEQLEKERIKAQRKQENAQARQYGLGRSAGGGLSVGALEGGRRERKRGAPGGKPKRHRPEYDSDDDTPQGVPRHENYDYDDGFLVGTDEEEDEEMEDDDDILDEVDAAPKSKRQRTAEPEDEDASGEEDEPVMKTSSKSKRRVIESDDEDDE